MDDRDDQTAFREEIMAHPHEAVPTLRVTNAPAAAAWYARLGFAQDWRHQHVRF